MNNGFRTSFVDEGIASHTSLIIKQDELQLICNFSGINKKKVHGR